MNVEGCIDYAISCMFMECNGCMLCGCQWSECGNGGITAYSQRHSEPID